MPIQVPAPVEQRVRRKFSRRAKVIGYLVGAGYLGIIAWILHTDIRRWWFALLLWGAGMGIAKRYLGAARKLEQPDSPDPQKKEAKDLVRFYEQKIAAESRRETAHGTLSVAAGETKGELSIPAEAGRLSDPEDG